MKKITILSAAILCLSIQARAQALSPEVLASAGDFYTSSSASLSWTAGESMTESFIAGSNILTQGFQQPENLNATVVNKGNIFSEVTAYPNPTRNILNLYFGNHLDGFLKVELFDVTGKVVHSSLADVSKENRLRVDLSELQEGLYLMKLSKADNGASTIIKIHKSN